MQCPRCGVSASDPEASFCIQCGLLFANSAGRTDFGIQPERKPVAGFSLGLALFGAALVAGILWAIGHYGG